MGVFTCRGSPLIMWKVVKRMLGVLWMNTSTEDCVVVLTTQTEGFRSFNKHRIREQFGASHSGGRIRLLCTRRHTHERVVMMELPLGCE